MHRKEIIYYSLKLLQISISFGKITKPDNKQFHFVLIYFVLVFLCFFFLFPPPLDEYACIQLKVLFHNVEIYIKKTNVFSVLIKILTLINIILL